MSSLNENEFRLFAFLFRLFFSDDHTAQTEEKNRVLKKLLFSILISSFHGEQELLQLTFLVNRFSWSYLFSTEHCRNPLFDLNRWFERDFCSKCQRRLRKKAKQYENIEKKETVTATAISSQLRWFKSLNVGKTTCMCAECAVPIAVCAPLHQFTYSFVVLNERSLPLQDFNKQATKWNNKTPLGNSALAHTRTHTLFTQQRNTQRHTTTGNKKPKPKPKRNKSWKHQVWVAAAATVTATTTHTYITSYTMLKCFKTIKCFDVIKWMEWLSESIKKQKRPTWIGELRTGALV